MEKVITPENGLPIKLWTNDAEEGALIQAINLSRLPFACKHIAIMPDTHQGYGMPIGGVLATNGEVIPNAVGVDIGCGVCACRTNLDVISTHSLKRILPIVRQTIPVGFNKHANPTGELFNSKPVWWPLSGIPYQEENNSTLQMGTLGGGNHFIEIQQGSDDGVWIMIHSGSRNLGKKVADHHNKIAVDMNTKWNSSVPKNWELAFLPPGTDEHHTYMEEMKYCVKFAKANRALMMKRVQQAFTEIIPDVEFDPLIDVAHNYAAMENHFGKNVMVHRKGATLARRDDLCIIPGSQGTASYLANGLGNPESFMSCSHGAGRVMGRKQAIRTLDLAAEQKRLDDLGVLHTVRGQDDLDEAAGAYKDIDEVMANQQDLVEIVVKLQPLAVIKG